MTRCSRIGITDGGSARWTRGTARRSVRSLSYGESEGALDSAGVRKCGGIGAASCFRGSVA